MHIAAKKNKLRAEDIAPWIKVHALDDKDLSSIPSIEHDSLSTAGSHS